MSLKLRELIRQVRACKTAAEERAIVAKECALMRTAFKDDNNEYRHRNVAKLLYIHMLGYPSHFGQMECVKLIASAEFAEKRIGYLALMLLLDERAEILMLVTNSLQNDLRHQNQLVVGLALTTIGSVCSREMARDLFPEVERHLRNTNPYIRKKALLCSIRVFQKVPELMEEQWNRVLQLLGDTNHSVLLCAVTLAIEMCKLNSVYIAHFRRAVPTLAKSLRKLVRAEFAPDYDVGGVIDPFLQATIMRLFRIVGIKDAESSEQMRDVLTQVATSTDTGKNSGNGVMYECVQTIMLVESDVSLKVLAINRLGAFLVNKDNNIRYAALQTLGSANADDLKAIQRHRSVIVGCLRDSDISIRRRATDLVYSLANNENAEFFASELLDYLVRADSDSKAELCVKIASIAERFKATARWHADTLIAMLSIAGSFCRPDVSSTLLFIITNAPEIQAYAAHKLFALLSSDLTQRELVHVALWCIGEYGHELLKPPAEAMLPGPSKDRKTVLHLSQRSPEEILALMRTVLESVLISADTRSRCLVTLLKLCARLPSAAAIAQARELINSCSTAINVELQQRSVEFYGLTSEQFVSLQPDVLAPMPPMSKLAVSSNLPQDAEGDLTAMPTVDSSHLHLAEHKIDPAADASAMVSAMPTDNDLLELLFGGNAEAPAPAPAPPARTAMPSMPAAMPAPAPAPANIVTPVKPSVDLMGDLFGGAPASTPAPAPMGFGTPASSFGTPMGQPSFGMPTMTPVPAPMPAQPVFGMTAAAPAPVAFAPPMPPAAPTGGYPDVLAIAQNGLTVMLGVAKPHGPQSPDTVVTAKFTNSNDYQLTDLVLEAAWPKYLTVVLATASSSIVAPHNTTPVTQEMTINNAHHGQKSIMLRLRISFTANGTPVVLQAAPKLPDGV